MFSFAGTCTFVEKAGGPTTCVTSDVSPSVTRAPRTSQEEQPTTLERTVSRSAGVSPVSSRELRITGKMPALRNPALQGFIFVSVG
jgi:hypothetical protein